MTMRGEVHCSAALHSLSLSLSFSFGMNCSLQVKEKMLRLVDIGSLEFSARHDVML